MRSYSINPQVSLMEWITLYRQYASQARRTGQKPVSFFRFTKGQR